MITYKDFERAKAMLEANDCKSNWFEFAPLPTNPLAPRAKAVPFPVTKTIPGCKKQEGNKPMRYNDNYASASATLTAPKSDAAVQREYFTKRLDSAGMEQSDKMSKTFNLSARLGPKNFAELIDMIKNDKFKINKKAQNKLDELTADGNPDAWYYDATYGIDWDGPKADYKGYEAALVDLEKQLTSARDTIMSGDAAAMKAAVEAFEAWTPTATTTAN